MHYKGKKIIVYLMRKNLRKYKKKSTNKEHFTLNFS